MMESLILGVFIIGLMVVGVMIVMMIIINIFLKIGLGENVVIV